MKNTFKVLGIIALLAIIGFSMAACDNGSTSSGKPSFEGTWTGTKYDGYERYEFKGAEYKIYRNDKLDENGTFTHDETSITFTVLALNYNGTWLDYNKGPWLWGTEKRIVIRNYEFIDSVTLHLFGGSSSLEDTYKKK